MWWLAWVWAADVDIETGAVARAGDRAVSPSTGWSIRIPPGMTGRLEGEVLSISGGDVRATLAVHQGLTLAEARAIASSGISVGAGMLTSVGAPIGTSSALDIELAGRDVFLGPLRGRAHIRIAGKETVVLVVFGPQQAWSAIVEHARKLEKGIRALEAAPPAASSPVDSSQPWHRAVSGNALHKYGRSDETSSRLTVHLCRDGRAFFSSGASGSGAGFSYASSGSDEGRWKLSGDVLTSTWSDGTVDSRRLSWGDKGEFLMDGTRWLRETSSRCP